MDDIELEPYELKSPTRLMDDVAREVFFEEDTAWRMQPAA